MRNTKKLTQNQYILECNIVHNWFYDYSELMYVNSRTKVKIICPIHGAFWQKAEGHKSGYGCPCCGELLKGSGSKPTTDKASFEANSKPAHAHRSTTYSYHLVKYVNTRVPVEIVCSLHGSFWQEPKSHMTGRGCQKCANENRNNDRKLNTEQIVQRSLAMRNGECTYPNTVYLGDKHKMEINCVTHGPFWQVASNHLQGSGCPKCMKTGYNQSKPGYLYILTRDEITKVGITNRTPQHRIKNITSSGGPEFELLSSYHFKDGAIPYQLETRTLKYLEQHYKRVDSVFDGSTECFLNVDLAALLNYVTPLATTEAA